MKLIRRLPTSPASGCVLTIGNFDGVHRGHRALIEQVKALAVAKQLPSAALVFEPQPQEWLRPDHAPPRLTSWRCKWDYLAHYGLEQLYCLPFAPVAPLSPAAFLTMLVDMGVQALVVGDDFHFGAHRQGNVAYLQQHAPFPVVVAPRLCWQGTRISSTLIRHTLLQGDFATAEALLGHPYCLTGRVRYGRQLGRLLGFPTANLALAHRPPLAGVYGVRVQIGAQSYAGVANIGTRPTVESHGQCRLEVHLLDFNGHLYGQRLAVTFRHFIRPEYPFASLAALEAQIGQDVIAARQWLQQPSY